MGGSCSCEGKDEPNEVSISVQVHKETIRVSQSAVLLATPEPPTFLEGDVRDIQSQFRTYLTRKSQAAALKEVIEMDASVPEKVPLSENGELPSVPDKLTKEVKSKLEKLGPFVYKLKVAGGVLRPPVELSDGSVYIGQWLETRRFGRGKLLMADGGYMEGYWNGDLHLQGRIVLRSGDHYEGEMNQGVKEGFGRFEDPTGAAFYEGKWLQDSRNGKGLEHIQDGSEYEGEFVDGRKHGLGVFRWASGEKYEGEFDNDIINGKGKYVWNENKWYEGDWKDGKMHGKGHFMNEGKEYVGDFVDEKKHGKGVYKWEGNVYEGDYKDNKMHGKGYLTMKGRERKLYTFESNKKLAQISETEQQT